VHRFDSHWKGSVTDITSGASKLRVTILVVSLSLLFGVSGAVQSALAASWYVSPTGSGTSCTQSTPCSLETAFTNTSIVGGDTVCIMGGVYPGETDPCGATGYTSVLRIGGSSASSPIMFTNVAGQTAIIEGNTRIDGQSCHTYSGAKYVRFVGTPVLDGGLAWGLVFDGGTNGCSGCHEGVLETDYTHDITLDYVEIRNSPGYAGFYQYCNSTSCGYNIQLVNSYIHDNGWPNPNYRLYQGIYWDENTSTAGGNLIANCVVENNAAGGIQLYSGTSGQPQYVTVEENTIINNGYYGIIAYGQNNYILDNVVANNGIEVANTDQVYVGGTNLTINTNIAWCWDTAKCSSGMTQSETNTIEQDPKFGNALQGYQAEPQAVTNYHNYRLQNGSPAFTTLYTGSGFVNQVTDKDGVSRSSTSALGAYVY
jgi:hypothetical protein